MRSSPAPSPTASSGLASTTGERPRSTISYAGAPTASSSSALTGSPVRGWPFFGCKLDLDEDRGRDAGRSGGHRCGLLGGRRRYAGLARRVAVSELVPGGLARRVAKAGEQN